MSLCSGAYFMKAPGFDLYNLQGASQGQTAVVSSYPLVNVSITMENHHAMGKLTIMAAMASIVL